MSNYPYPNGLHVADALIMACGAGFAENGREAKMTFQDLIKQNFVPADTIDPAWPTSAIPSVSSIILGKTHFQI